MPKRTETTLYYVGGGKRKYMGHGPDARSAVELAVGLARDAGHGNIQSLVEAGLGRDYVLGEREIVTDAASMLIEDVQDEGGRVRIIVFDHDSEGVISVMEIIECDHGDVDAWAAKLEADCGVTYAKQPHVQKYHAPDCLTVAEAAVELWRQYHDQAVD